MPIPIMAANLTFPYRPELKAVVKFSKIKADIPICRSERVIFVHKRFHPDAVEYKLTTAMFSCKMRLLK